MMFPALVSSRYCVSTRRMLSSSCCCAQSQPQANGYHAPSYLYAPGCCPECASSAVIRASRVVVAHSKACRARQHPRPRWRFPAVRFRPWLLLTCVVVGDKARGDALVVAVVGVDVGAGVSLFAHCLSNVLECQAAPQLAALAPRQGRDLRKSNFTR